MEVLRRFTLFARVAVVAAMATLQGCSGSSHNDVIKEVPWALIGQWLVMDTHTHTRFSDGAYPLDEVVRRGVEHGCDALAITDHGDLGILLSDWECGRGA